MSDFGLVQITRQRIRPSVVNSVSKVCPMCGGSGSVVSQDTIITDIESWISKLKYSTQYRAVDIYVNPYLKSFLTKGIFSPRWKWQLRYKMRITFIADENTSLNEFKATLKGSELDITDAVWRDESIEKILEAHEVQLEDQSMEQKRKEKLDYYSKNDRNGNGKSSRSSRSKRPRPSRSRQS